MPDYPPPTHPFPPPAHGGSKPQGWLSPHRAGDAALGDVPGVSRSSPALLSGVPWLCLHPYQPCVPLPGLTGKAGGCGMTGGKR